MKFKRQERYERFEWTARKLKLASGRPVRQAKTQTERYPLLADQLPAPAEFNQDAETQRRNEARATAEARMRAHCARVWRESRSDFFKATPAQQDAIRAGWNAWRGPLTAHYFRYMVDEHTGVMEARSKAFKARERESLQRILSARTAQATLDLA